MRSAKQRNLSVLTITLSLLALILPAASPAAAATVAPSSVTLNLLPGQTAPTIPKTVKTDPIPPNPAIVLMSDTTGSMGPAIANVQSNITGASGIVATVAGSPGVGTVNWDVAEYKDGDPTSCASDPFAFKFDLGSFTTSAATVATGTAAWSASGGCDTPESDLNALNKVATTAPFPGGAGTKIVVWFGDAPSHDPNLSGPDPSHCCDLGVTEATATANLVAASIHVVAVCVNTSGSVVANDCILSNVSSDDGLDAFGQATRITGATGGVLVKADTAADVSNAILAGLKSLPVTVTWATSACDPNLSVGLAPASQTITSGGSTTFTETVKALSGATPGSTLLCTVTFSQNGVAGPTETISVKVVGVTANPISAVEGQSFSGTVGTISGTSATATASQFAASIDWGDLTSPTTGTVSGPTGGPFTVSGTHTYAEEGSYTVKVTVTGTTGGGSTSSSAKATVNDAPIKLTCLTPAVSLNNFSGPVAKITDSASPSGTLTDFTSGATIDWGDATSTAGTVTGPATAGPYTVSGSHTYTSTGTFTIKTTVKDVGGSKADTDSLCKVLVAAFPDHGSFEIGNLTEDTASVTGSVVNFWGPSHDKTNSFSGGHEPAQMKGWIDTPSKFPLTCGTKWTSDPGNSSDPPVPTLPAFMATVVSSTVTSQGPIVSGDTAEIVVVQTNLPSDEYSNNPGHEGTGPIVAELCPSNGPPT